MIITSASGTPLTGTRQGQVFTTPGSTNIVRNRVVPLQPKSNPQVDVTLAIATAAQYWKLLPPANRDLWAKWFGPGQAAYNAFVQVNSNAILWGSSAVIDAPYFVTLPGIDFAVLYAEPDGVHTTLAVSVIGQPAAPHELWCRLYINFQQRTFGKNNSSARAVYAGSWGPLAGNTVNLFDFTDWMSQLAGQWWYPASTDTASETTCGNNCTAQWYATDQFGMPSDFGGPYPVKNQFAGIEPGQLGAGVCPFLPGPPYPWPTSDAFYGGSTLVNTRIFATPGTSTYTPSPGTNKVLIQIVGGGGGGAGAASPPSGQVQIGGSGSGGGFIQVTLSTDFSGGSITVGAGGPGGAAGAHAGSNGSLSSFTTSGGTPATYTANGGTGGITTGSFAPPIAVQGVAGGSAAGGDLAIWGGPSGYGFAANVFSAIVGNAGSSQLGQGALGLYVPSGNHSAGITPAGYGGGGSGAGSSDNGGTAAGGNGNSGAVVIYEFS